MRFFTKPNSLLGRPAWHAQRPAATVTQVVAALVLACASLTTSAATEVKKSFSEMGAGSSSLRLTTAQAAYTVKLPLSPREVLTGAVLHLDTVNSTALIRSRSELAIRVNGRIIGQYALDPLQTQAKRDVALPLELLKPGYNDIEIGVVQHYTYECEDAGSPELWTEINAAQSYLSLTFDGIRPSTSPRLSQLNVAFDKRGWLPRPVSVVVGTEKVTAAQMNAAALVAQGIGLRMGYRPVHLDLHGANTASAIRPENTRFPGLSSLVSQGRDVVLVGRRAELSRYLDAETYALLTGPFVGIFSLNQGDSVVLVVSGNTDEELRQAAKAVAEPTYKFSDVPLEAVLRAPDLAGPVMATPKVAVPFSLFDFRTSVARGARVQPTTLEFRVPADYGAAKGDLATMKLHFSYGAGLRPDSSMVVKLNGNFAVAVPLSEPTGTEFQKFEVKVPAQFLKPGYNTLTFEPVFNSHKDRCVPVREEGMVLTIYEDSTLELPSASVPPTAPDLSRFAAAYWPMDQNMRVYLSSADTGTANAALGFLTAAAQRNRYVLNTDISYSPFEQGHMMIVGPSGSLPDDISKVLPLQRYSWSPEGPQAGLLQAVAGDRVITALVASNSETLNTATRLLSDKGLWKDVEGKAAVIDTHEGALSIEPAGAQTNFGTVSRLTTSVTNGNWLIGGAIALCLVFVFSFVALLRRRSDVRESESEE